VIMKALDKKYKVIDTSKLTDGAHHILLKNGFIKDTAALLKKYPQFSEIRDK
jgi:uncharacterized protein YacL